MEPGQVREVGKSEIPPSTLSKFLICTLIRSHGSALWLPAESVCLCFNIAISKRVARREGPGPAS
jgi:hypothetical protein